MDIRKLKDQINAAPHCIFRSAPLINDRRLTALREMTGHDGDHDIASGLLFCFFDLVNMTFMKRIVFRDNSAGFHRVHLRCCVLTMLQ